MANGEREEGEFRCGGLRRIKLGLGKRDGIGNRLIRGGAYVELQFQKVLMWLESSV